MGLGLAPAGQGGGGRMIVCNLRPGLRDVFVRLRLASLFTICESEQQALEALKEG